MIVSISQEALLSPNSKFPFRAGTLQALLELKQFDVEIYLPEQSLTQDQLAILAQEDIEFNSDQGDANFFIKAENQSLQLFDSSNDLVTSSDQWAEITKKITNPDRVASIRRDTRETKIAIDVNLDGTGESEIDTGLKFFDHMLEQISRHGLIDLKLYCKGDLEVDEHHTIEDVAIALGEAISTALGDKKGIERYSFVLPMDETQATVALDLSGRPYLVFDVPMKREYVGDFPTEMLEHFYYSLAMNLKATLHVKCSGENDHHKIEACFKGLARTLKTAIEQNGRIRNKVPSSKGTL